MSCQVKSDYKTLQERFKDGKSIDSQWSNQTKLQTAPEHMSCEWSGTKYEAKVQQIHLAMNGTVLSNLK